MNLVHSLVARHTGESADHDRATEFIARLGAQEGGGARRWGLGGSSRSGSRQPAADQPRRASQSRATTGAPPPPRTTPAWGRRPGTRPWTYEDRTAAGDNRPLASEAALADVLEQTLRAFSISRGG